MSDLPGLRFARLYSDGSMSVEAAGQDLESAKKLLSGSSDDDDTDFIEVHVRVVRMFGKPKMKLVKQHCITCPTCSEEIWYDEEKDDE